MHIFRSRRDASAHVESSKEQGEEDQAFHSAAEEMRIKMEKAVTAEVALIEQDDVQQVHADEEGITTLQIDVADDQDPLPLAVKRSDDPLQRAKEFVQEHNLPESYVDRIADFIKVMLQ